MSRDNLKSAARRVADALHPSQVILFGSHAWGNAGPDSDVDLMVVMDRLDEPGHRLARRAYHALWGLGFPVDFVIRSRAEMERRGRVPASLERQVLDRGIVLYG